MTMTNKTSSEAEKFGFAAQAERSDEQHAGGAPVKMQTNTNRRRLPVPRPTREWRRRLPIQEAGTTSAIQTEIGERVRAAAQN